MLQIQEFKQKDRMSEAELYLTQLQNIQQRLDEFAVEVRGRTTGGAQS